MIGNAARFLTSPSGAWQRLAGEKRHPGGWLVAAGLTAVVLPSIAVVAGHLGSFLLGHVPREMAIQRAAVGLVAAIGGGLTMAPALTLALLPLTRSAHAPTGASRTAPAAMGILWPAWTAGLVLAVPPLIGLGPEIGEILWLLLAVLFGVRVMRDGGARWLGVRRRWMSGFLVRTTLVFAILFGGIAVTPALVVRAMMGVESKPTPNAPAPVDLPLPPRPNW